MTQPETTSLADDQRSRWALAIGVYALATLALCWPMLAGQFAVSPLSDQFSAGYGFREFGAAYTRAHGALPQWNPYLFGGLPFIAAMHGDIFYPTAWLRLVMPVDTAMNLGFALHLLLAGVAMHALLRRLRFGFGAALTGGLAYQLSGIVASLIHPGHDGKLFVSALAPLVLLALHRAILGRQVAGYGALAVLVGLCMVSPHYQLTYYLLVAAGLWTLWLVFLSPDRPGGSPVAPLAAALGAVLLGVAISAAQALPFLEYIQFSPRGAGGASRGWEYATSFALPPAELLGTILPDFNGVIEQYWGVNGIKFHTEYLGVVALGLAVLGWGNRDRRKLLLAVAGIAALFLLIALGGHTPFYRLWYAVMPMMKSVRAPGMAFFLVALSVAIWVAAGVERLLAGDVPPRAVLWVFGTLATVGLLGSIGVLQGVATGLADPRALGAVLANEAALRAGSIRLLLTAAVGGVSIWAVATGRARGMAALALVAAAVAGDLWGIDRRFFRFSPPASQIFGLDPLLARMEQAEPPFRMLDYGRVIGMPPAYDASHLMPHRIQDVLGYHGNEIRYYDDLLGGKNVWRHLQSQRLWDLLAVQYLVLPDTAPVPGFHLALPPTRSILGRPAVLYERDGRVPYARILGGAAKVPEEQIIPTLMDPRFPLERVVLLPDTSSATPAPLGTDMAPPPEASVAVRDWEAGRMTLAIEGTTTEPAWLLVSENWYPDWHATVDGQPVPLHRGDGALLALELPAGARSVELEFRSARYAVGRAVSLLGLLLAGGLLMAPLVRRRRDADG